jgi:ureidoglycolate hydrolase
MTIKAKKISAENFASFGKVVVGTSGKPTSQAADYKFWSDIMNYKIDGETEVGICTVYKQPSNSIYGMERHLHTPEILIPIDAPFILPLLNDRNDPNEADAFIIDIGQAIAINEKVWHGACIHLEKMSVHTL